MLYTLVARDIKQRTRQAFLGYLWIMLEPLLAAGVFTFLMQNVLHLRLTEEIPYPIFVLSGMILWRYFSSSLGSSVGSLTGNYNLITQVYFPRKVLVLYPIASNLVNLCMTFILLWIVLFISGIPVKCTTVFVPLPLLLIMMLTYGLGLIAAPINVAGRDMGKAIGVLLGFFLYATPVLYPVTQISMKYRDWYYLNPIAVLVEGFLGFLMGSAQPPLWAWAITAGSIVVLLLIGNLVFNRFERVLSDII